MVRIRQAGICGTNAEVQENGMSDKWLKSGLVDKSAEVTKLDVMQFSWLS